MGDNAFVSKNPYALPEHYVGDRRKRKEMQTKVTDNKSAKKCSIILSASLGKIRRIYSKNWQVLGIYAGGHSSCGV